ncbi:GntR family transcriptional regulator [Pseudarthrobacter sp. J1738]|uniref:GntR family transcriptional regulator n=1 Tax=unclassified Pseudarthrobacter TaxID=2647000 RepID=UPI003D2BA1C8
MRASERAYQSLHDDILQWQLPPGTVLTEVEQSQRLGISRTPLREALSRLSAEGLTTATGGRGVVVTDVSAERVRELFELRVALDSQAAALAAQRGNPKLFRELQAQLETAASQISASTDEDPDRTAYYSLASRLDEEIDAACGNSYLVAAQRQLRVHLIRLRRLAKDNPARLQSAAAEHATIAAAIAAGDSALAAAATRIHLHKSLEHLLKAHEESEKAQ